MNMDTFDRVIIFSMWLFVLIIFLIGGTILDEHQKTIDQRMSAIEKRQEDQQQTLALLAQGQRNQLDLDHAIVDCMKAKQAK